MPDITMCAGKAIYENGTAVDCGAKERCYRYTAQPGTFWQSYFVSAPFVLIDGRQDCDHYWRDDKPLG